MEVLQSVAAQYLTATLHASALILVVLLLKLGLKKQITAKWQFLLWLPVVIRLLMPIIPESPFSIANVWKETTRFQPTAERVIVETKAGTNLGDQILLDQNDPVIQPLKEVVLREGVNSINWELFLACGWLTGAVLILVYYGLGWKRLCHTIQQSRTLKPPQVLKEALDAFSIPKMVPLLESSHVSSPGLAGMFRPKIFLPAKLGKVLTEEQLKHICFHECAHLKRRDLFANVLLLLSLALHWFNPLVWYATRKIKADMELACDEFALTKLGAKEAEGYGKTIITLAEMSCRNMGLIGFLGIIESSTRIKERIRSIAAFKEPRGRSFAAPTIVATLILVGTTKAQVSPEPDHLEQAPRTTSADENSSPQAKTVLTNGNQLTAPESRKKKVNTKFNVTGREELAAKLRFLTIKELNIPAGARLGQILESLENESRALDSKGRSINFIVSQSVSPQTGEAVSPNLSKEFVFPMAISFRDVTFFTALDSLMRAALESPSSANGQLSYAIEDYAVVITQSKSDGNEPLYTRRFRVDPNQLTLEFDATKLEFHTPTEAIRELLKNAGAFSEFNLSTDLRPSTPKSFFFNERTGFLLVRATLPELQLIAETLAEVSPPPSLIQIEITLIYQEASEHPPELLWNLIPQTILHIPKGKAVHSLFRALNSEEMEKVTGQFQNIKGIKAIQMPKIVTVSGRLIRTSPMEINTRRKPIDPSVDPLGITDDLLVQRELPGYVLDVLPTVEAGQKEINLKVVLKPNDALKEYLPESKIPLHTMHNATETMRDGSSLMVIPIKRNGKPSHQVYFITPTLLDPNGSPLDKNKEIRQKYRNFR